MSNFAYINGKLVMVAGKKLRKQAEQTVAEKIDFLRANSGMAEREKTTLTYERERLANLQKLDEIAGSYDQ